jgi:hypothetical protein
MHTGTELTPGHFVRKLCSCFVAAPASQFMATVLFHDGLYLGKLKSLVSLGLGCLFATVRVKRAAALLATGRVMVMNFVHFFRREQISLVALVPFLASWRMGRFLLLGFLNLWSVG